MAVSVSLSALVVRLYRRTMHVESFVRCCCMHILQFWCTLLTQCNVIFFSYICATAAACCTFAQFLNDVVDFSLPFTSLYYYSSSCSFSTSGPIIAMHYIRGVHWSKRAMSAMCARHYSASQQRNHNTIFFAGLRDKLRAWRNSQSHSHTEDKSNRGFFLHIRRIICPEMRYRLHVCTSSQPQILTNVSLRVDYEHRRIAHTRPAARPLALSFARYELWNITHSTVIVDHWEIP